MKKFLQKAKKTTAFFLAVMLIAAMIPATFAAEADTQVVDFTVPIEVGGNKYWSFNCGSRWTQSTPSGTTGLRAQWTFSANGDPVPTYTSETTNIMACAYKFTSSVSGTFIPSIAYTRTGYSGIMRAHCIPADLLDKSVSNNDSFQTYVKENLGPEVEGIGDVDFAYAAGATGTELERLTLKEGKAYYFVFILIGQSNNRTDQSKKNCANHNFKTMTFTRVNDGSTAAPESISYIVRAKDSENNGKITVEGYTVNGTNVGEWTVNTEFTATADPDGFAYWANSNGTPVSEAPTYTFTPKSNFVLEAVYAPADTATKKVQFWNYNKVYLNEVTATEDTLGTSMPANPTLNGWSFTGWMADGKGAFTKDTVLTDVITRVVAQFEKKDKPFTVDGTTYDYDGAFSKTADDKSGENVFSHWTVAGQVASYSKTLAFNVWNNVAVEAVYAAEAPDAVPTIVLDKVNADEYFILYEVPAGYTAVDAGIVFSEEGTPSVNSADSKASVKSAGAKGQFTAAPGEKTHTVARGYVMYKDSADNYRVIYSEVK